MSESKRDNPDATDAELAVLEVLWAQPDSTIRGITDRLYPGGGASHYATVQKLLERLEAKGFVWRKSESPAHRFSAAVNREELIGRRLRAVAERLCDGAITPLITSLVNTRKLSQKEIGELRALVDRLDKSSRR